MIRVFFHSLEKLMASLIMLVKIPKEESFLVGDLYKGSNDIGSILFIFHGYFSSNRHGPAKLYDEIATHVLRLGISVVKFDCRGFGESEISFDCATYDTVLEDQETVVNHILSGNNYKNMYILGHSMGCSIAARLAKKYSATSKLLLLSPAVSFPSFPKNLFSDVQWLELKKFGKTERKGLIVNNITIQKMFCESNLEVLERLSCEIFIILPEEDQFYSLDDFYSVCSTLKCPQIFSVKHAEHNFLPRSTRVELFNYLSEVLN